jgi:calcineurin-like phosphoesterase family protein
MKLWLMSDLHIGHNNILKYREGFSSVEEHHNTIYENLATSVGKRDTVYLLGDVAFTKEWLKKIKDIRCGRKVLICGNHDQMHGIKMRDLVEVYDEVFSLASHRNVWLSHCPMHSDEIRNRFGCFHGHTHQHKINDPRYINLCVEHTDYKPRLWSDAFDELMSKTKEVSV